jgi:hypothetical protein
LCRQQCNRNVLSILPSYFYLSENALVVDDEEAPERVAVVLEVNAVVLGDGVCEVGEEGNVQTTEPALLARGVHPCKMGEVRVHRAGHNLKGIIKIG